MKHYYVVAAAVMQLHGCFSLLVTAGSHYLSCFAISNNLVWTELLTQGLLVLPLLLHHSDDDAELLGHFRFRQPEHSVEC